MKWQNNIDEQKYQKTYETNYEVGINNFHTPKNMIKLQERR